jgi:hypothetical protein
MLLEVNDDKVMVDKTPWIHGIRLNLDAWSKELRLKFSYDVPGEVKDVDLAISYSGLQINLNKLITQLASNLYYDITFKEQIPALKQLSSVIDTTPNVSKSLSSASVSMKLVGLELLRGIPFKLEISFSLINKNLYLKGNFGSTTIDQQIKKISDILGIIKL